MDTHVRAITLLGLTLFASVVYGSIVFSSCELRDMRLEEGPGSAYELGVVECKVADPTATPLYLQSTIDPTIILPSTATPAEIDAAIAASTQDFSSYGWANWMNFAKYSGLHGQAVPNYAWAWNGNVKLQCGSDTLSQSAQHSAPLDFLYTLPPKANSANALWTAMGAFNFGTESVLPGIVNVVFIYKGNSPDQMISGTLTKEKVAACIGVDMNVIIDQDTYPSMVAPTVDEYGQKQCTTCSAWKFTDSLGNRPTAGATTEVTRKELTCNVADFIAHVETRQPTLFQMLENATSEQEMRSAVMTYSTLVTHETYAGCSALLERLYNTSSQTVTLLGVEACVDPNDPSDPCCHRKLRWSQCCVPSDKSVVISGLYESSDSSAISTSCGSNSATVQNYLDQEFGVLLMAVQHPSLGCDAVARKKNDPKIWQKTEGQVVNPCISRVFYGQSKYGKDTCNANQDCYSKSCPESAHSRRCTSVFGEAAAEPLLECLVDLIEPAIWKFIAKALDVDSSKVNKEKSHTQAEWDDATLKFKTAVATPNCAGVGTAGWCVIEGLNKAECDAGAALMQWERRLQWIDDTTNADPAVGFCKKLGNYFNGLSVQEHYSDDSCQNSCQQIFAAMSGHCMSEETTDQGSCTGTWVSYTGKTVSWYRLQSQRTWILNPETGHHDVVDVAGDEAKCEMEKSCNWDPDGSRTGGDETKCLEATNLLSGRILPSAAFEENGNKMECLQCWGSRCQSFWPAHSAICAVAYGSCSQHTGGGPNNDSPVAELEFEGDGSHYKCRRDTLATASDCLISTICPVPAFTPGQHESDLWIRNCENSGCFDLTKTQDDCVYDGTFAMEWRADWKNGAGICEITWHDASDINSKANCEGQGHTWWEGRVFKAGMFDASSTCTGYCDDQTWPPKETCPSDKMTCDSPCPQCTSHSHPVGVCVSDMSMSDCGAAIGYQWDYQTQVCHKREFTGDTDECSSFGAGHTFHTCVGKDADNCRAYCWAKNFVSEADCNMQPDAHWLWKENRCAYHGVSKSVSQPCSNLNADTCWQELGCWWDGTTCQGRSTGCNQYPSETEWVAGTDESSSTIRAGLLHCQWEDWRPCATESTCLNAGECQDWFAEGGGVCVVPHVPNDDGHWESCDQRRNPTEDASTGATFGHGDRMGCVVRKTVGASTMNVNQTECSTFTDAKWVTRAESQQGCLNHGSVCHDKYNDYELFGGFSSQQTCEGTCGYKYSPVGKWRSGQWKAATTTPLFWRQRSYASVNKWEPLAVSHGKFRDLINNGIASMQAQVQKTRVYCSLGPFSKWIPVLTSLCGAAGVPSELSNIEYPITTDTVECGNLANQPASVAFDGSAEWSTGTCSASARRLSQPSFQETTMNKVVIMGSDSGSGRSCSAHEFVLQGQEIVGQNVGPGMKIMGVDNVQVCITPSVPTAERCAELYTVKDVAEVSDAGAICMPLSKTITVNLQGQYCFSGAMSGKTYVPVILKTGSIAPLACDATAPAPAPGHVSTPVSAPAPASGPVSAPAPAPASAPGPVSNTSNTVPAPATTTAKLGSGVASSAPGLIPWSNLVVGFVSATFLLLPFLMA